MAKLAHIESEAMRRLGRMPEGRRRARQQTLVARRNAHGPKIRVAGVRFLAIDDDPAGFGLHGQSHVPVSARQVGAMLGEIRHAWLG